MYEDLLQRIYYLSVRSFSRHPGNKPSGVEYCGCRLCGVEWAEGTTAPKHNKINGQPCPIQQIYDLGVIP